jgi:flagellar biosynthesis/type III secretory pathway chaperone
MNEQQKKLGFGLKVVLEQELALLESLLEVLHDERELLVQFKPDQLFEHSKRKELLVLQHTYLEQNRNDLSQKLKATFGLGDAELSLREIAAHLDGELGHRLMLLRDNLSALVESIQEANELNKSLIGFSIRSVKSSVSFLKSRFFNSDTYSSSGIINENIAQLSMINSRA